MQTRIYYFHPTPSFAREKPYGFKFPPKDPRIPRTNMEQHEHDCAVNDLRGREDEFTIEKNGFAVLKLGEELDFAYDDYHDEGKVQGYFRFLERSLKAYLGAGMVRVFRWGIRKRDVRWPQPELTTYLDEQPTTVAHVDATLSEAAREVRLQEGDRADDLLSRRYQWFNFWKPLKGPLNDWPLLLCDAATVDKKADITEADLIYPDHASENMQVFFRANYKWYYLSDHQTDEVLVFKQADSMIDSCAPVPHCLGYNPLTPLGEPPRESIEVRALVYY